MLVPSSHMEGTGQLGREPQDPRQGFVRKSTIERLIDVLERHAVGQALENQRHRKARAVNHQLPAEKPGIGNYPTIIL